MEQYIKKSALVSKIEKRIKEINLDSIEDWHYRIQREHDIEVMKDVLSLIDTLETKEVMPALDNGKMPIERWKMAVEAASIQANYRKSQGLTETCDDYFVDGVQWGDEHPIVTRKVDLEKLAEQIYPYPCPMWFAGDDKGYEEAEKNVNNLREAFKLGFIKAQKGK